MNIPNTYRVGTWAAICCSALTILTTLTACSGSESTVDFEVQPLPVNLELTEGNSSGVNLPIQIVRRNDHDAPITLSVEGTTSGENAFISASFDSQILEAGNSTTQAVIQLAIADLPIMPQRRNLRLIASDGTGQHVVTFQVNVTPVDAPDIYLLIGQSNMVGFSDDGTRDASIGGPDATNPRIRQLNATANNQDSIFIGEGDFTSATKNLSTPSIVLAEDPLHIPLDSANTNGKSEDYIGLGLTFAKQALANTTRDIILIPAAWSGSAFCANEEGPTGQWNAQHTSDPALGNTWLFDRAVTRANLAIQTTGGILRGILWHQGESDANDACAPSYEANLERLVQELRQNITADARGGELRNNDSNIPFVIGTMSRGIDNRGDFSVFSDAKERINLAHRNIPNKLNAVALSNHDDLTPANGFTCGNATCIHFGAEALREMGRRYYAALLRAVAQ